MKAAFFMVSLICALALGLLSYIMATGRIPLQAHVPEPPSGETPVIPPALGMPAAEKAMIADLVKALQTERDAYARKRKELAAESGADEMRIKVDLMEKLKADLQEVQSRLEEDIRGIQASERRNLQNIADVYGRMEPANAANLLLKMDKRRAATVLSLMPERLAAGIMDEVALIDDDSRLAAIEWAEIIRKMDSESN